MEPYVIRQGDYLARLAYTLGFDADTVWRNPQNAQLRKDGKLSQDPNVLRPTDVLYVPDQNDTPAHALTTGTTNTFVATVPTMAMKLKLHDERGPLANLDFTVLCCRTRASGTTSGEGTASFDVDILDRVVTLAIPKRRYVIKLQVGGLDPVETPGGLRARLQHLGYLTENIDDDNATAAAVRAFQTDEKLPVTGVADAATAEQLRARYGC